MKLPLCPIPGMRSTSLLPGGEYIISIAICHEASETAFSSPRKSLSLGYLAFLYSCDANLYLFSSGKDDSYSKCTCRSLSSPFLESLHITSPADHMTAPTPVAEPIVHCTVIICCEGLFVTKVPDLLLAYSTLVSTCIVPCIPTVEEY